MLYRTGLMYYQYRLVIPLQVAQMVLLELVATAEFLNLIGRKVQYVNHHHRIVINIGI